MTPFAAVLTHNVVALHAEPSGKSEQVSQGVLGETVEVLEQQNGFVFIRTSDAYQGWVRDIHLRAEVSLPVALNGLPLSSPLELSFVIQDFAEAWETPEGAAQITKLVWGTRLYRFPLTADLTGDCQGMLLPAGSLREANAAPFRIAYVRRETLSAIPAIAEFDRETACTFGKQFIGTPYLWGGGTPFGFDCSGFVQRLYAVLGVTLPRDAYLQAQSPLGVFREPGELTTAGDLVFFGGERDPRSRGITHVGMALDSRQFLHASGGKGVTISAFDDADIQTTYTYRGSWSIADANAQAVAPV